MTSLIDTLRDRARRRAAWRDTRNQLSRLPLDTALDLDIHRADANRIATRAVYGR